MCVLLQPAWRLSAPAEPAEETSVHTAAVIKPGTAENSITVPRTLALPLPESTAAGTQTGKGPGLPCPSHASLLKIKTNLCSSVGKHLELTQDYRA